MAWSKNGTPNTLSGTADDCSITDLTAKEFNVFLFHKLNSGNANTITKFNSDAASVYAARYSQNGGTDATLTLRANLETNFVNDDEFLLYYVCSISGEEKLVITFVIHHEAAGASTAPSRLEMVQKYVPSPDADITEINWTNTDTGDFAIGTNASALSGDTTEEVILGNNVQSGSRFEATDTRKIYYRAPASVTFEDDFSSYTTQGSADSAYPSENTSYTRVNISNDTWEFNQPYSTSIHAYGSHDFGSGYISNNKWVLRFVVAYSTWNEGSSHNIVLSSGDHTVSSNTSGYQNIGVRFEDQASPDTIYLVGTSNGVDRSVAGSGFNPSGGITTGTSYYVEIIRNVNSYTLNVRTGSHSGTLLGTETRTVSGITSLRYLKISNIDWDVTNSTGDLVGAIDNIQLWNGVSSTTDLVWTEEV